MSFMHHSYLPIAKPMHMDRTTRDHLLTLSKVKKNTKWRKSSITDTPGGLEPFNILSSGKGTQKQTTPGNQLTRSTLRNSLKPITDNTPSRIKGGEPTPDRPFTPSLLSFNVCRQICQRQQRVANVDQTPFT